MTSKFKEEVPLLGKIAIMVPLVLILLIIIPLLMAGWIYEGPRRLVVKSFRKVRRGRI